MLWRDGKTDALSIAVALSKMAGKALPWLTVREALDVRFVRVCSIVPRVAVIGRATIRARPAYRLRCQKQARHLHRRHLPATHVKAQKVHSNRISFRTSLTSCLTSLRPPLVWR